MKVLEKRLYQVRWAKSRVLAKDRIAQYNDGKPSGVRVKQSQRDCLEKLIFYYSKKFEKDQVYGDPIKPGEPLPPLLTNNVQLADALECHENSVINHRKRLKQAGLIQKEVFRGTNGSYEVYLDPSILHIQLQGEPDNSIGLFLDANGEKIGPANIRMSQNLGHTVTSTYQVTNKLIELSGADFQQSDDNQSFEPQKSVGNDVSKCGKPQINVENPRTDSGPVTTRGTLRVTKTGNETDKIQSAVLTGTPSSCAKFPRSKKSPPYPSKKAPGHISEVLAGLPDANADKIRFHVKFIWAFAKTHLYCNDWISDSQKQKAYAFLAEYFIDASPNRYAAGANQIIERMMLVKRWLDNAPEGENRWIALPADYFNPRNEKNGFRRTKDWFKEHQAKKARFYEEGLLTKSINKYLKACEPGSSIGRSETYRKVTQTLGKRDPALLDRFNQAITKTKSNESDQISSTKAS